MKGIILLILSCATALCAQDTVYLNGTATVNFKLPAAQSFIVDCVKPLYTTRSTYRSITGVGRVQYTATGTGYITPVANYTGTWTAFSFSCGYKQHKIVFLQKKPAPTPTPVPSNSYTLTYAATTSCGVYKDGALIRTLWNMKQQAPGVYQVEFDGKDDNGAAVGKPYEIRVVSSAISETWYNHIGNTSTATARMQRHRGLRTPWDAVEFNGFVYYCTGLPEGETNLKKAALADLGKSIEVMPAQSGDINLEVRYMATDGTRIYYAGFDAYATTKSCVFATDINDNEVLFSSGAAFATVYGRTYPKAICIKTGAQPKGIAVGSHLYVSNGSSVFCLNKTSGAAIRTQALPLNDICIDGGFLYGVSGNSVIKYSIAADGTLNQVSSTSYPKVQSVSVKNGSVVVSEGFKDYNNYIDKGFVYHGASGVWYGEVNGISRKLNGVQNAEIRYIPMLYNVSVDRNNPKRVFAGHLEYEVSYTDMSWKFVKDWMPQIPANFRNPDSDETPWDIFRNVVTVGGKTFALLQNHSNGARTPYVVELTAAGIVTKMVPDDWAKISLDVNGDIVEVFNDRIERQTYNGSGWNAAVVVSIIPDMSIQGSGNYDYSFTTGALFNPNKEWGGRHLGAVKNGKWLYKVSPSFNYSRGTYFPQSDTFPTGFYPGDGYAGGRVYECDSFVTYSYVGEFWGDNGGQVNKWNFYLNGLMVHQYGATAFSGNDGRKMAGNAYQGQFYKVGSDYYISYADESWWGCIQMVKFTGFDKIQIHTIK